MNADWSDKNIRLLKKKNNNKLLLNKDIKNYLTFNDIIFEIYIFTNDLRRIFQP